MANEITLEPSCRYGHGSLKKIDRMRQMNANFGLSMLLDANEPGLIIGFHLFVCPKCGYTELFDEDVAKTIQNMDEKL